MSSYGPKTAFGVGMIHGVGAETGTRSCSSRRSAARRARASASRCCSPSCVGLLISNFAIVVMTSVGFVASQTRERIYVVVGLIAGVFSLVLGTIYLVRMDAIVPEMDSLLPF